MSRCQSMWFLLCGVTWMLTSSAAACACNTTATWDALAEFYRSTNGPQWKRRDNWLVPGTSVCTWLGIWTGCVGLSLYNNNLRGTLPPELATGLPLMQHLNLRENNLSGTLPAAYSAWRDMRWIFLYDNLLVGSLPPSYASWTNLTELYLSNNSLSGTLPHEYQLWTSLEVFETQRNALSGVLPEVFKAWTNLRTFKCSSNALSGTLPHEYSVWSNLRSFDAHSNRFSGTLPMAYASWSQVETLTAHSNMLTGTLPTQYEMLRNVSLFDVSRNHLSGTLPPEYGAWRSAMTFFYAMNNLLSGTLPASYGMWSNITDFAVSQNRLSGTIPAAYGSMTLLRCFCADNNALRGTVPMLHVTAVFALHSNVQVIGQLSSSVPFTLLVSVCNTSLCGNVPPMWTSPLTLFFCQDIPLELFSGPLGDIIGIFRQAVRRLPCLPLPTTTTTAPAIRSATTGTVTALRTSFETTGATAAVTAILTRVVGQLQVSQRVAAAADSVSRCRSYSVNTHEDELQAVGALVCDNPTRMALPGRLALTTGTVVGNTVLLAALPCAGAFVVAFVQRCRSQPLEAISVVANAFIAVFGVVQVPTVAAATIVLIELSTGEVSASLVAAALLGVVVHLGVPLLVLYAFTQHRSPGGKTKWRRRLTSGSRLSLSVHWLRGLFLLRRSCWDSLPDKSDSSWAARITAALLNQMLGACHYPHSWMVLHDVLGGLVCGVLLGVASSLSVSCGAVVAAMWALLGVVSTQVLVAVVVWPRPTVADCVFQAVMCLWTAAGTLLAALGVEEESVVSAVAQSVLCVFFSLLSATARCWRLCVAHRERRPAPMQSVNREVSHARGDHFLCFGSHTGDDALRKLIAEICAARAKEAMVNVTTKVKSQLLDKVKAQHRFLCNQR